MRGLLILGQRELGYIARQELDVVSCVGGQFACKVAETVHALRESESDVLLTLLVTHYRPSVPAAIMQRLEALVQSIPSQVACLRTSPDPDAAFAIENCAWVKPGPAGRQQALWWNTTGCEIFSGRDELQAFGSM